MIDKIFAAKKIFFQKMSGTQPPSISIPGSSFRPISRTSSTQVRDHLIDRRESSHLDRLPLSKLLLSKDFGATPKINEDEEKKQSKDSDEIEGDAEFAEPDDINYQNVFSLDKDQLAAKGLELQTHKNRVEFYEEPPARFGTKHKKASPRWKKEETQKFYEVLAMCGTDFSMISKFFPERSRKMIVNKFHCEEKKNTQQFQEALSTPKSIDIEMFSKINGVEAQTLIEDFQKNKDKLLNGQPLMQPKLPENSGEISGNDDDFEDIEERDDDKGEGKDKTIESATAAITEKGKKDEVEGTDDFNFD